LGLSDGGVAVTAMAEALTVFMLQQKDVGAVLGLGGSGNTAIVTAAMRVLPVGAVRWKGGQPNKVWTSRGIKAPTNRVWAVMRDFAGMGSWHSDITKSFSYLISKSELPLINYVSGQRL
jgi:uncharacterized membrane protein